MRAELRPVAQIRYSLSRRRPVRAGITVTARMTLYFDFVSPNSYIAAQGIGDIAARHARAVDWRPVSLFHVWGTLDHPPVPTEY